MRLVIACTVLLVLCGSAYAQAPRPNPLPSRPLDCLPIDFRPECHVQIAKIIQSIGPCIAMFNAGTPDAFFETAKQCAETDIQAVIDNANQEPKDAVALACVVPAQSAAKAAAAGNAGFLLAFQLYRRAKNNGTINACVSYVTTTITPQ